MKDRFKHLRRDCLKLTQQEMAEKLGKKPRVIAYYESGERNIDDGVVFKLQQVFGINPSWIKDGVGEVFLEGSNSDDNKDLSSAQMLVIHAVKKMDDDEAKLLLKYIEDNASRKKSSETDKKKKLG